MRNTHRGFGLVIFPIGIVLAVVGILMFVGSGFLAKDVNFSLIVIGMLLFGAGGFMTTIGFGFLGWGFQGKIASYSVMETKDAVTTVGDGAGEGFAWGIGRSGGIKLDMRNSRRKEVVKIRCRRCGYLDSEDAKFCSKCGSRI